MPQYFCQFSCYIKHSYSIFYLLFYLLLLKLWHSHNCMITCDMLHSFDDLFPENVFLSEKLGLYNTGNIFLFILFSAILQWTPSEGYKLIWLQLLSGRGQAHHLKALFLSISIGKGKAMCKATRSPQAFFSDWPRVKDKSSLYSPRLPTALQGLKPRRIWVLG